MNSQLHMYKGFAITTRHYQQGRLALDRFDACFTVAPPTQAEDWWQVFAKGTFSTSEDAVANALAEAKNSIDASVAAARRASQGELTHCLPELSQ